jgi:ligand-binding sensor domain-containing protein
MQAQAPVSVHISEKEGLPDKEFYDVLEDDKGFIWLCANKGFFRYDGKVFKNYSNLKQRGLSIFNVQQGPLKRVWCNNISGQFFYIQHDKLNLFIDLSKELKGELADFVVHKEYLWVFSIGKIYKINLKTKLIVQTSKVNSKYGVPFKFNNTTYFRDLDSLAIITSKNTIAHLLATNLPLRDEKGMNIPKGKATIFNVKSSLFLLDNRFYRNSFFQLHLLQKSIAKIKGFEAIAKERIYTVFVNDNEIWIATNSGVWVYEFMGSDFRLKKRFLKHKDVTKILKDKDANYWLCTLNDGLYILPNIYIENCTSKEENANISSLDIVNDSTLVFGTTNGNVGFYNVKDNTETIVNLPTKDRVSTLIYDSEKNIVFISKDMHSYLLNYETLASTKIKKFETAKSLTLLEDNKLLFTSNKNARIIENNNFKNPNNSISVGKRTYASHYSSLKKTVYIAYVDHLIRYDSLWKPQEILYDKKPIYTKSITETEDGIVWAATFKDGIYGIKNDTVIYHYTIGNGLTSNKIAKVKADQNSLWIALENSIQVLDIKTSKIKTLRKSDGVLSYNISGIEMLNNKVYFSSNEGLFSVDKQNSFKTYTTEVYFNKVEINEKDTLIKAKYILEYNQNAIKIGFNVNGFLYNQKGKYRYRLKRFNDDWLTTDTGVNSVKYNSLPAGKYTFQVQAVLENSTGESNIKELQFVIRKPFWGTWWFILGVSVFIFGGTVLYFRKKIKVKEQERVVQLEKISLEKELIAINLTALRSQMNPHFIFNSLNSIQDLILKEETEASYDYIVMFAELVRNTLSYSSQDFISIEKELDFLKVYLQLEKLRFGDAFTYSIHYDGKENLEVPSLLVQPFIENALVHGLLHKEGEKQLDIVFSFVDNVLQCVITDNGIGRKKAAEIGKRQGNHHASFALSSIEKRLEIFKKQYSDTIGYRIEDLYKNETATGTRIVVIMPFKKRF